MFFLILESTIKSCPFQRLDTAEVHVGIYRRRKVTGLFRDLSRVCDFLFRYLLTLRVAFTSPAPPLLVPVP
jgi:hypothetical protein